MSYVVRVNGKKQSQGFSRLQPAVSTAELIEAELVEVVDETQDGDRLVWTKKHKGGSNDKAS